MQIRQEDYFTNPMAIYIVHILYLYGGPIVFALVRVLFSSS